MSSEEITRLDLPYQNLILAGFVGVGKSTVGKAIASKLDVEIADIDDLIVKRERMGIRQIRQELGDARLKTLENDVVREAAFLRQAVIVVGGAAMLNQRNADLLSGTGRVISITCELGEALHRLHMAYEDIFRDAQERRHLISRLRREFGIADSDRYPQIDTTHLTIEQTVQELIFFWKNGRLITPEIGIAPSRLMKRTSDYLQQTEVSRPPDE